MTRYHNLMVLVPRVNIVMSLLHGFEKLMTTCKACGPVALLQHDGCVSACDFSKDGEFIASSSQCHDWLYNSVLL